ncbi:hypothetical protein [Catenulispora rubra]|uniref:hypothetical protein n=1 Tax=Catenulispora rubra TaxID=280293 RepID=UPI001892155C|nr:hypothetical protein [Catenulispora rubra]
MTTLPTSISKGIRHMRAATASAATGVAGWAAGIGLGWPAVIVAAVVFISIVATLIWVLSDGNRSLRLAQLVCTVRTRKLTSRDPSLSFGIERPNTKQPIVTAPVLKELPRQRSSATRSPRSKAAGPAQPDANGAEIGERLAG